MPLQQKILAVVTRLFIRMGVRTISMDDIARELGISKKTLYRFFPAKEQLVTAVIKAHIQGEKELCDRIVSKSQNAIDEVVEIFVQMCQQIKGINPSTVYELKKYFPEAWSLFTEFKNDYLYHHVLNNLKSGIKQGLYRKQIKPEIIARIYVTAIDRIIDPELFSDNVSIYDLYEQFIVYHLHGIVSDEGRKHLDNKVISKKIKI